MLLLLLLLFGTEGVLILTHHTFSCLIKQLCFRFAAKNLALAGVRSVTVHDVKDVDMWDLSGNFFLSEQDIGKNRALACISKLQELNNAVLVSALTEELTKEHLSKFQVCLQSSVPSAIKLLMISDNSCLSDMVV